MEPKVLADLREKQRRAADALARALGDAHATSLAYAGPVKLFELALHNHAEELLTAAEERDKIVAMARAWAKNVDEPFHEQALVAEMFAEKIERGEHLK